MAGLALTALFGFVSFLLSWGIFVPSDLKVFSFIGAVGSMAGYLLGELTSKNLTKPFHRGACIAVSAVVCIASVIAYTIWIQRGSAEVYEIVVLALLLAMVFFSFTFLMPLAGVLMPKISAKGPNDAENPVPTA